MSETREGPFRLAFHLLLIHSEALDYASMRFAGRETSGNISLSEVGRFIVCGYKFLKDINVNSSYEEEKGRWLNVLCEGV